MEADLLDAGVMAPIHTEDGSESDHKTVFAKFRMKRVPSYKISKYTYLRKNEEGLVNFDNHLKEQDWATVLESTTPCKKVHALHTIIELGMEKCFERKTSMRKTSEPSWISKELRSLIRRRRAVFKREGRSNNWWRLKKKTIEIVKARRTKYNEEKKSKVLGADQNNFYKCVNSFLNHAECWDVRALFPKKEDCEVAEELAEFFNRISNGYPPSTPVKSLCLPLARCRNSQRMMS